MLAVFNISILYFKWQWIHFHACNQIQWVSGCSSWSKVASSPYVLWQSHCYFIIWIHSRPTRKCFQRAFVSLFMLDRYSAFTRFRIQPTHDRYNLQMHLDVCVNSYGMLFVCIRSLLFEKWPDRSCFVLFLKSLSVQHVQQHKVKLIVMTNASCIVSGIPYTTVALTHLQTCYSNRLSCLFVLSNTLCPWSKKKTCHYYGSSICNCQRNWQQRKTWMSNEYQAVNERIIFKLKGLHQ